MIIDAHVHIGTSGPAGSFESTDFGRSDKTFGPKSLLPLMDQLDIQIAVVQTTKCTHDNFHENRWVADMAQEHSDRLIAISLLHPYDPGAVEYLETLVKQHGSRGLKLHPFLGCYAIYLPTVHPIVKQAIKLDIPIMIHSGTPPHSLPTQIGLLADYFPDAHIIMAHAGISETYGSDARYTALRYDNIYLEVSNLPAGYVKMAVDAIGADRIMYGSDTPWNSTRQELQKITQLKLTDEQKEKILWRNTASLFKIKTSL